MANILNLYKKEEDKETGIINFIPIDEAKDTICGRTIEEIIVILNCLDIDDLVRDFGLKNLLKLLHPDDGRIFDVPIKNLTSFDLDLEDPDILTYEDLVELIISTWNRRQYDMYPDEDDAEYRTIISIEDFE